MAYYDHDIEGIYGTNFLQRVKQMARQNNERKKEEEDSDEGRGGLE
jgi:hypothetical protein